MEDVDGDDFHGCPPGKGKGKRTREGKDSVSECPQNLGEGEIESERTEQIS
jgi:hypothetical protein